MESNVDCITDSNTEINNSFCVQENDLDMTKYSDEIKEMFCEECEKHDNSYNPAEGFCEDCVEYKCKTCIKFHRRYFGNHHIQDKGSMPQEFCFERCTKHPNELIKFYCVKCEKFACCECRKCVHQNCPNVKHLLSFVKNIEDSEELRHLKENMDKTLKDIDIIKDRLHRKAQLAHTMESRAKATIKEHKSKLFSTFSQNHKEIIKKFDKEMEDAIAKLRNERQELVKQLEEEQIKFKKCFMLSENDIMKKVEKPKIFLEDLKSKTRTLTNKVAVISNKITQTQCSGQKCKLFIEMKTTKEILKTIKTSIEDLKNQDIPYYMIFPLRHEKDSKLMPSFFSFVSYDSLSSRVAIFDKPIYINSAMRSCLCLLSPNKLMETDYSGKCINAVQNIDSAEQHDHEIKMPSNPYASARIENNTAAVTFPFEGIVRVITFSESLTVDNIEEIKVGSGCRGIAYSNNYLLLSYPGKVQIFDMAGNVLNSFENDRKDEPLFSYPHFLALSPNNKTLYMSDWSRHTVTSMTLESQIKAIYKDDQLREPWQLTVDEAGTVYVCGRCSNNVHQLSSDLKKVKVLLNERQELTHPVSIAYCLNNSRLYVGMRNSNNIKVFKILIK